MTLADSSRFQFVPVPSSRRIADCPTAQSESFIFSRRLRKYRPLTLTGFQVLPESSLISSPSSYVIQPRLARSNAIEVSQPCPMYSSALCPVIQRNSGESSFIAPSGAATQTT